MELARSKFNAQIYQEACEWFVEFRTGAPGESARRAFHDWLTQSPDHVGAYLEATTLWNEGAAPVLSERWTPDLLIAQAQGDDANVIALADAPPRHIDKNKGWRVRRWQVAAALATLVLTAGIVAGVQFFSVPSYTTAIGEQRSLVLPDGSAVTLNARSGIDIRYTERERVVDLVEGQALFDVVKDSQRPFSVTSDATRVRAIGTQFDVNRTHKALTVTVIEGRVAVSPQSRAGVGKGKEAPTLLAAGERVVITSTAIEKSSQQNTALATAWTQRQLVFASTPLAEVAEEFNRYNKRQLVVRDPSLEVFRIDGVFSSTDPGALIRFLRERSGVQVVESGDEVLVMRKRSETTMP